MKKHFTYRAFTAMLLVGLILQVVVLREAHHLLDHHHEAVLHCDSADTHLHGSEYAPIDCFVCDFHFAPAQMTFPVFFSSKPVVSALTASFFYQSILGQQVHWHFQQRGPPTFLS